MDILNTSPATPVRPPPLTPELAAAIAAGHAALLGRWFHAVKSPSRDAA